MGRVLRGEGARGAVGTRGAINPAAPILARAHQRADHEIFRQAGATEVIQPELEASATVIRHASAYIKLPDEQVRAYLRGFREAMDSLQTKPVESPLTFPEVREVTLTNAAFAGRSLREHGIRERFGVTIVAITRATGEVLLDPPADTVLHLGDEFRILGLAAEVDAFIAQATGRTESPS